MSYHKKKEEEEEMSNLNGMRRNTYTNWQ